MSDLYSKEYGVLENTLARFLWTYKKETEEKLVDDLSNLNNETEEQLKINFNTDIYDIKDMFKKYGMMLAGGTINSIFSSRKVNDLDFYFKDLNNEQLEGVANHLKEIYNYKVVCKTKNAVTLVRKGLKDEKYEIQLISRFTGTPQTILDTFDFTIVQGIFDFEIDDFILGKRFLIDIAKRKLEYTNTSRYPICALYRTEKYKQRGYTLSGGNIVAISLAINALEFNTYADLKDQLLGIDTSMVKELTDKFDDNKKFELSEFMIDWYDLMFNLYEGDN